MSEAPSVTQSARCSILLGKTKWRGEDTTDKNSIFQTALCSFWKYVPHELLVFILVTTSGVFWGWIEITDVKVMRSKVIKQHLLACTLHTFSFHGETAKTINTKPSIGISVKLKAAGKKDPERSIKCINTYLSVQGL